MFNPKHVHTYSLTIVIFFCNIEVITLKSESS